MIGTGLWIFGLLVTAGVMEEKGEEPSLWALFVVWPYVLGRLIGRRGWL